MFEKMNIGNDQLGDLTVPKQPLLHNHYAQVCLLIDLTITNKLSHENNHIGFMFDTVQVTFFHNVKLHIHLTADLRLHVLLPYATPQLKHHLCLQGFEECRLSKYA